MSDKKNAENKTGTTFGVVRKVDDLGRAVIPQEYRNVLGLKPGMQISMTLEDGAVVIRPYDQSDMLAGEIKRLRDTLHGTDAKQALTDQDIDGLDAAMSEILRICDSVAARRASAKD